MTFNSQTAEEETGKIKGTNTNMGIHAQTQVDNQVTQGSETTGKEPPEQGAR